MRSAIALAFKFWFLFAAFGGSYCLNDDCQQLRLLKSTWSELFTIGLFLLSSRFCYITINEDWKHWSYRGSDTVVSSMHGSFLSALLCRYLMNDDNKQCLEYLRYFITLLSSIGSLFQAFLSFCYAYDELCWRYYHLSIIAFISTVGNVCSAAWRWRYMHDTFLHRCYYLRSATAVMLTEGFSAK